MALIKCTECGHMISDRAMKCPKCGCPSSNRKQFSTSPTPTQNSEKNFEKTIFNASLPQKSTTGGRILMNLGIISIITIIVTFIALFVMIIVG